MNCGSCGTAAPPGARFCGNCGAALSQPVHDADRRQLTVLFCDLVGATELSERLDPEDLRDLVHAYQNVTGGVVNDLGGTVAQYLGDGILVYFGYPEATEDAPRRAVQAGLGMIEAVKGLAKQRGAALSVRIGIHTGPVVTGEVGTGPKRERLALGQTPNLAARLQGLAEPDTAVLSAATYQLLIGFFECENLGEHSLKGISEPVTVFKAVAARTVTSRFEVAAAGGLEPLVGRLAEQQLLSDQLRQIAEGRGAALVLKGEAGIGKSRLVHVAREHARDQGYLWLETSCSRLSRQSPLHPVVSLLRDWFGLHAGDSAQEQAAKLERGLAPLGREREQAKPRIAALLGLPATGLPVEGSPQLLRSETLRYVVSLLNRASDSRPVVLAVEDLHWADPSTLEFLGLLIDQTHGSRMLTMLTARPSFEHSWSNRAHVTEVTLNHLDSGDVRGLVTSITGGKPLPEELVRMIVAKTDGVPLFVEELTRMILNSGSLTGSLPELAIPDTLKDLLAARLDSLGAAKETAQVGAVLGHSFGYPLIRAVSSMDEARLSADLEKLVASQLLLREGVQDEAVFTFKHALLQDAAYDMLLKKSRQGYHSRVASVLVQQFPETAAARPELVAQHHTQAGEHGNAVDYWFRAGHKDLMASANLETIEHVEAGLESLKQLEPGPDRDQQELKLRGLLAPALMATRGFASAELEQTLDRSQSLVAAIGEGAYAFPILWGVWSYYQLRGRYAEAEAMARRNMEIALASGDVGSRIEAMICIADTKWYLGQNAESAAIFEEAERLYDPTAHSNHAYIYGLDPRLFARCHRAMALWRLGYPQRAGELLDEALRDAEGLAHANTTGMVLMFAAFLAHQHHDAARVAELAGRLLALCQKHGLLQWTALGMVLHGWAGVQLGSDDLGTLMQGLGIYEMTGARMGLSYHRSLLAEAHVRLGQAEQGLEVIERCIRDAREMRETFYLPQLLQLLGDWSLNNDSSNGAKAENAYRESLALAESQQARLPALRTATSLARWLDDQERTEEAVTVLQNACAAYPGASDAHDIAAGRAVLAGFSRT